MKKKIHFSPKLFRGQNENKVFSFEVDKTFNKKQLISDLETQYHTKIEKINSLNRKGKKKIFKGFSFQKQTIKLVYVTLKKDASNIHLMNELNQSLSNRYNVQNNISSLNDQLDSV